MPPMASRNKANNGPGDAQTVARCSESSESGATADRRGRAPGRLRDSPHVAITDRSGPLGSTASPAAQHDAYRLDFDARVHGGRNWQLPVLPTHLRAAEGRLSHPHDASATVKERNTMGGRPGDNQA